MGLRNHPHASASFPTVTFGKENKSTPTHSAHLLVCLGVKRVSKTPYSG